MPNVTVARHPDRPLPMRQRFALTVSALSAVWMLCVLVSGGIDTSIAGVRIKANEWLDPAVILGVSLLVFARQRQRMHGTARPLRDLATAAVRGWRTPAGLLLAAILAI